MKVKDAKMPKVRIAKEDMIILRIQRSIMKIEVGCSAWREKRNGLECEVIPALQSLKLKCLNMPV